MFSSSFFANNRKRLAKELSGVLIVVAANGLLQRSADTNFRFRQDSSFWYLTGLDEPDLLLVIDNEQSMLVLPERRAHRDLWEGKIDVNQLKKLSGVQKIITQEQFTELIKQAKSKKQTVGRLKPLPAHVDAHGMFTNPARLRLEKQLSGCKKRGIRLQVARLRQVKQLDELIAIQKAVDITVESLKVVKKQLVNLPDERAVTNLITSEFVLRTAEGHAYEPIVASGANACTLHYVKNNNPIAKNQFLLIDAGAEYNHYAADITRTWPIGKQSNTAQKIWQIVEQTQSYAMSLLKPGIKLKEYEHQVHNFLVQQLVANQLFTSLDKAKQACPHGISHFLGLDVHDAGDYNRPLAENMVLTVEPGVYLPKLGIGVRIEDDVVITKTGCRSLSAGLPH